MGNYTKGKAEFADGMYGNVRIVIGNYTVASVAGSHDNDEEREANAALISEAFNVAHETGLTPRQLAGQRERLMACLRAEVADLKSRMFGSTHWQGCEEAHPKCAALKRMQNAIAEADGATP